MTTARPASQRTTAAVLMLVAVGVASTQDAIVKGMSGTYPAYETVIIRALTSIPLLLIWLSRGAGLGALANPHWRWITLRGFILCSAYFAFVVSIAALPIANMVAIYFTMPFFVAGLAGPFLGERVPIYRWIAIVFGFIGVIVMVRPGSSSFQPVSLLALYSALGYAVGQMMGRSLAGKADPLVIANLQNLIYFAAAVALAIVAHFTGTLGDGNKSLAFLTRPFALPTLQDAALMVAMGLLAAVAMVSFIFAYQMADASFVAPLEYSSMGWAVMFGYVVFGDFPDRYTWAGMAIVAGAGLFMLVMDRRRYRG
jgi:drug/metabolite transporter (DMT)-like permease